MDDIHQHLGMDEDGVERFEGGNPSTVTEYRPPRSAYMKTTACEEVLNMVDERNGNDVIHVYGMSGCGKSQIVRHVCEVLEKCGRRHIRHVRCTEGVVLQEEWKAFVSGLATRGILHGKEAMDAIDDGDFRKVVMTFKTLNCPVLLVVEDVGLNHRTMLQSFIQHLVFGSETAPHQKPLQILVATQTCDAIFPVDDIQHMTTYGVKHVQGFTSDEAAHFLKDTDPSIVDEDSISKLAEQLAYSPLRLTLARQFCRERKIPYKTYYEALGQDPQIIRREKELLCEHPELGRHHGYEVIMKAVRPSIENAEERLQFKVIQMMSFISNEDIPDLILERFFQETKKLTMKEAQLEVRCLLHKLEKYCALTVHVVNSAPQKLSSIHMDVLSAIRLDMTADDRKKTLVDVLHSMSSLASKDNRFATKNNMIVSLTKHINRVISLAYDMLKEHLHPGLPDQQEFQIRMSLAWLLDVLGFAETEYLSTNHQYLEKASEILWNMILAYAEEGPSRNTLFECYGVKSMEDAAADIYEKIKTASEKIPVEWVAEHHTKIYPASEDLLEGMQKRLENDRAIDWDAMKSHVQLYHRLSAEQIGILRRHGMLLTPEQLRKAFFTERLASVLHSQGRRGLVLKERLCQRDTKKYEWFAKVGLSLTEKLADDSGIKTVYQYFIKANSLLPHQFHTDSMYTSDEELFSQMDQAKKYAQDLKRVDGDFYEHGRYKEISGTPFSLQNVMKFIVKANRKMYRRPDADRFDFDQAMMECKELHKLALDNKTFVNAWTCMIHAGKYYAAIGKFGDAIKTFEEAFELGINLQIERKPKLYAWALYNTGRAICAVRDAIPDINSRRRRFLKRYKTASGYSHLLRDDLKKRLDDCKKEIEEQ